MTVAQTKPWEGRLAETSERPIAKRRPVQRQCPEDFDVIFVEVGREDCENWYRASKITITRWLEERGKARLVRARADYVAMQRANGAWLTRSTKMVASRPVLAKAKPIVEKDDGSCSPALARLAAQYLRISRNGGWRISPTGRGDWHVGIGRMPAQRLLALAVNRGFDVAAANLQIEADEQQKEG